MKHKTFLMSFAYDVPHYADFTIKANNEKDAIAKAEAALARGCFEDVVGEECLSNATEHRVFSQHEYTDRDAFGLDEMTELHGFNKDANETPEPKTKTAEEQIAILRKALETIAGGDQTGRWLDDETGEAIDDAGDENADVPGATWEPYTEEEQTAWIDGLSQVARAALNEAAA